jgi:L-asparaginase/Glu-tRNA(Gln) amidotransferase subunit D
VAKRRRLGELGIVTADNLNPQKARILLMLALTRSKYIDEIQHCFDTGIEGLAPSGLRRTVLSQELSA